MKVIVGVQRVIDYKTPIRVKADQSGVETANVKMSMNPFDEIAVEAAIRYKEQGLVKDILVVAIGPAANQEILRTALAMGADRALNIFTDEKIQSLAAAKIFQFIAQQEQPDCIILGKQAIDNDNNQTGQMLAGLLDWPQGTFASKCEFSPGRVVVTREVDGGLETLLLCLPAVITTDLRLNEPRFISLPNIMQAKKKPLETQLLSDLNIDTTSHLIIKRVTPPAQHRAGIKVNSVVELIDKLKNTARVI